MKGKRFTVLGIVQLLACAVFVVGLKTFAGPCSPADGSMSMCAHAGTALTVLGVAAIVVAVIHLALAGKAAKCLTSVVVAVLGIFIGLVPGKILALCMMATMQCNQVMRPFALVMGLVICIIGVVEALLSLRRPAQRS